jgi:hypothetical protein
MFLHQKFVKRNYLCKFVKKIQISNSEQIGLGWAEAIWAQPMSKRKLNQAIKVL